MVPQSRVMYYKIIATAQRESGDEAGGRETLQSALKFVRDQIAAAKPVKPDRSPSAYQEQNRLLGEAVHLQAELGDVKGANGTVREIHNGGNQGIEALKGLAVSRAAAGDLDGAMEAVDEIGWPKFEAEVLEGIAAAITRRKDAPER